MVDGNVNGSLGVDAAGDNKAVEGLAALADEVGAQALLVGAVDVTYVAGAQVERHGLQHAVGGHKGRQVGDGHDLTGGGIGGRLVGGLGPGRGQDRRGQEGGGEGETHFDDEVEEANELASWTSECVVVRQDCLGGAERTTVVTRPMEEDRPETTATLYTTQHTYILTHPNPLGR